MANYNTGRFNEIIDHAEEVYGFLSGNYMNEYENHLMDCRAAGIEIGPMQFVRILQYRRTEDIHNSLKAIRNAMSAGLSYCARHGAAMGYYIVSKDGEISVYLAAEDLPASIVAKLMSASIPDLSYKTGFIPASEARRLSAYGGVISGDIQCSELVADMLVKILSDVNGIVAILAVPFSPEEKSAYVDALNAVQQRADTLLNNDMTYTSQARKTIQREYHFLPELNELLKQMSDYYSDLGEDFWKSCICFSCDNREALFSLGNSIAGTLNSTNENNDKARVFMTTDNPIHRGSFFLPSELFGSTDFLPDEILLKPSLLSYVSTSHLASVMQLPSTQVNGFDVIDLSKTEQSLHLFDVNSQPNGNEIQLGRIAESGTSYTVALKDITEHVMVTGATGTGKTNTVLNLVRGIHSCNVPILIIEPSKKDYWLLGSEFRDMRIYSFGQDAELLRINPLLPEEGVIIGNHIDSLLYAFSGAFEMEEPTRLALDGLLKDAYEQFGWKTSDIAFSSGKSFPQIKDLLRLLPDYCKTHLPYGDEVRNNIYGSLVNRLSSLNTGMIGESVNAAQPITGKELCTGTVLVELDDLSLETKPFVAMLLMIKVDQHLRQGDTANRLKNVIVLEEAHNIFASIQNGSFVDPREKASRYFSNMLSQIRGYGAGIIVADQGPSQINDMAISNTKVKIIHGIVNQEDIDKVSFALNLTEVQKRVFPALRTGEAVVAVRGSRNVNRVRINRNSIDPIGNIACLFCKHKKRCESFNRIDGQPLSRAPLYAQRIMQNRFFPAVLKSELDSIASYVGYSKNQTLCLLGRLLSDTGTNCGEREKRRIIQRYLQSQPEA